MGAVTGNKWWGSLKYRIRDFAIKYSRQLKLDRTKMETSFDDRLSRAVERGDSLTIDIARRDIERYKGFVVITRLKRVPNEAVKCNAFTREEEVRWFPHRYIEFIKSPYRHALWSNREMRGAFRVHLRDRFARCPDLSFQEFRSYLVTSSTLGKRKRLAVRARLLNAKSVMR